MLEELKELHEEVLAEKDTEILATAVELAFCHETVALQNEQLQQTQCELLSTQSALQSAQSTIAEHQQKLQEQEEEVNELQKSLWKGKRSAQAVLGMLTLGALLTTDD